MTTLVFISLSMACNPSDDSGSRTSAAGAVHKAQSIVRELDFSPFDQDIDMLDAERVAWLDDITRMSDIGELRQRLSSGEMSARELTLFYLSRIRRFDGSLSSVIELAPDALSVAERLDELHSHGRSGGRLHGIPILLKDNIAAGPLLHNTAGAAVLREHRPDRDAFVVEQLRAEGGVILGKTNLSEWAYYLSSSAPSGYSALGGQVINPFGSNLQVLGSSTGSAVASAARFAAATIGTETTGSIIAPAALNGVAGMRPTMGLVSSDLIIPIAGALDSAGPISRYVSDLAELLNVMSHRHENGDMAVLSGARRSHDDAHDLATASLEHRRIGIVRHGVDPQSPAAALFASAAEALQAAGAEVVPVEISAETEHRLAVAQGRILEGSLAGDLARYLTQAQAPINSLADVVAFNQRQPDAYAPYGQDLLIRALNTDITPAELNEAVAFGKGLALTAMEHAATDTNVDILVSLDNAFSLYYALAGTPAVTVPIGRDSTGQPHGATFVGIRPGLDGQVLQTARAFEQATRLLPVPDRLSTVP